MLARLPERLKNGRVDKSRMGRCSDLSLTETTGQPASVTWFAYLPVNSAGVHGRALALVRQLARGSY
jgi:hypothetical protein